MDSSRGLTTILDPVIDLVPQRDLTDALRRSLAAEPEAIRTIEGFFKTLPRGRWSRELLRTVLGSWKATHLKMLAIYGLSCRLQRLADKAEPFERDGLHLAAACNAMTSYEDLGLDYDGHTHSELYDDFAAGLVGDDTWQLRAYRLPEAHDFSRWVYRNMVVEDIGEGLLTNMFSEIYNHGEYSIALGAFDSYLERYSDMPSSKREGVLTYIRAHVEDDTEADHFRVVIDSLNHYYEAAGQRLDPTQAEHVFRTYLRRLAPVMQRLTDRMFSELSAGKTETVEVQHAVARA
jgi:hypothetical protein